jgi:hypothetical protein
VVNNQFDSDEPRRRKTKPRRGRRTLLRILGVCAVLAVLVCGGIGVLAYRLLPPTSFPAQTEDYVEARKHFRTRLVRQGPAPQPGGHELPPPGVKEVDYQSGGLRLTAWVNQGSGDLKRPAVLFLHGGFAFGTDDWDQAQPFRDAGFVVMARILRGENGQPGVFSLFYEELEDVLSAAEALAALPEVELREPRDSFAGQQ